MFSQVHKTRMEEETNVPLLLLKHEIPKWPSDENDILPINGIRNFFREFSYESKKLWYLAGPAIFTSLCQYSLGAVTQLFAGHVGPIQLAAVSVENSVIMGIAEGVLLGMGSALETLCGQSYGAKELNMLGIYMQRSWIILNTAAILLTLINIFATQILMLIGQPENISRWAGKFAMWMIPQVFSFALEFPIMKFLQAQSKIMVMAVIAGISFVLHTFFTWLLMLKLGWGLPAGAAVLNGSWWFMVIGKLVYIFLGSCGEAWSGFSWKAFHHLWEFVRLSLASGIMICLEYWYFMSLILSAGYLKNADIAVDATSICTNIVGWTFMLCIGFNAAISVRVSNELGAGRPRRAKFSVLVVSITSLAIGAFLTVLLFAARNHYPALFTNNSQVQQAVYDLTPILGATLFINSLQPTLSGVAIGAGWQEHVAYVNIVCYYFFGIPLGLLLTFLFKLGIQGMWYGMLVGTTSQTCVLIWMIAKTDWENEASVANDRIQKLGGHTNNS
ncbi:protein DETOXIFICATION 29-like [Nicotiana sylvestris]|uniref:Protein DETOXIFICATION n=1 Tax=Nicotiana sylvestris TaxID=4096 RepID=A0A1U7Y0L4_NICSY|nr:PREDICTED: protein TRANSPARENT TESTA 12-like [Nicotiana sylvestris]